jgi:hypothetical protein
VISGDLSVSSKTISKVKQWLDDESFYGGPSPTTVDSAVEIIRVLVAEAERLERALICIRERASVFYRPGKSDRPRQSGTNACSWIKEECDGVLGQ